MKHIGSMLAVVLLASACGQGPVGNAHVPQPAKAVELKRYLGQWHELARYENRFERGCADASAHYALRDDGKIAVTNSCHKGAPDGPLDVAEGVAHVVDGSQNAKLEVTFFWPFYGDYWVLDHADDYSWSIVGEPSGRYLWILSRTPAVSKARLQALVARVEALGYDTSLLHVNAGAVGKR